MASPNSSAGDNCAPLVCPVCGCTSPAFLFSTDADIFECETCSHVFTRPSSNQHTELYDAPYYEEVHSNWFRNPNTRLFELVSRNLPENCSSVLDVGCGKGSFLRFLRHWSATPLKLIGVDCSSNTPEPGIEYRKGNFENMQDLGLFDAVVSLAVLEHLDAPVGFADHLARHCRKTGILIVMTINNNSMLYATARLLRRFGVNGPVNRLYSIHHLQHFTSKSLKETLKRSGFEVINVHNHNAPLRAIDIPAQTRWLRGLFASAVGFLFLLGTITRRTYLQTIVARPRRPGAVR